MTNSYRVARHLEGAMTYVDTRTRLDRACNVTEAVRSLGQGCDRPTDKADSTSGIGLKGARVDVKNLVGTGAVSDLPAY